MYTAINACFTHILHLNYMIIELHGYFKTDGTYHNIVYVYFMLLIILH